MCFYIYDPLDQRQKTFYEESDRKYFDFKVHLLQVAAVQNCPITQKQDYGCSQNQIVGFSILCIFIPQLLPLINVFLY
jgi:hypothetical protein